MEDLSPYIQSETETVKRIYAWHKKIGDSEEERGYLGASSLGEECERALWYSFRGCVKRNFIGRLYRLFETGNLAEARFVSELRGIGCEVHEFDEDGKQFAITGIGGHFSGHMDGCALGIPEAPLSWHVVEFKTHSSKNFAKLKKNGVETAFPKHFAQMMVYMGGTAMQRALYLAVNKDTDELYSERIRFDSQVYKRLMTKARRIIESIAAPPRLATRQDSFACKWCDAKDLCWSTGKVAVPIPKVNCRTCCHSTPITAMEERTWACAKHGTIDGDITEAVCDDHLILPCLVNFAEPTDAGDDWIEFTNNNGGEKWKHGKGFWQTRQLISSMGPLGDLPF